jgi:hypothetical protein
MTAQWHREHDSVAGSVTIPKALEAEIERSLNEYCGMDECIDPEKLPWVVTEALDDLFSDIQENGPEDPRFVIAEAVRELCRNECETGAVHFVKGRA